MLLKIFSLKFLPPLNSFTIFLTKVFPITLLNFKGCLVIGSFPLLWIDWIIYSLSKECPLSVITGSENKSKEIGQVRASWNLSLKNSNFFLLIFEIGISGFFSNSLISSWYFLILSFLSSFFLIFSVIESITFSPIKPNNFPNWITWLINLNIFGINKISSNVNITISYLINQIYFL